jgi:dephospho-CoA kinase
MDNYTRATALTGGIGCGKSSVLKILKDLGCLTIDSDLICHQLYEDIDGSLVKGIVSRWGSLAISNGRVNRKKIADIVFRDKNELEWLNGTIHPLIYSEAEKIISSYTGNNPVVFDVPLLFETGMEKHFSLVIAVWTTPKIQIQRLTEKGWSHAEITGRLNSQMSPDEKLEKADYGIINTGSMSFLYEQCKNIYLKIKKQRKNYVLRKQQQ